MRPTLVSPSRHGINWKVSGSGIATMSDSSIALKPVIDEPSKPIPSSSASSISLGVTANDFRWPSMSVNQRRTNSTPSSLIRFRTSLRAFGSLVALSGVSTCVAIDPPRSGDLAYRRSCELRLLNRWERGPAVRVLIADDDDAFVQLLRELIDRRDEIVGVATTGAEAIVEAERLRPDLVLMDLDMPVLEGDDATRQIVSAHPETKVVIVSGSDFEA